MSLAEEARSIFKSALGMKIPEDKINLQEAAVARPPAPTVFSRMKKTVLKVECNSSREMQKIMKAVSGLQGVESVSMDREKQLLTVIGEVDTILIVNKAKKKSMTVEIMFEVNPDEILEVKTAGTKLVNNECSSDFVQNEEQRDDHGTSSDFFQSPNSITTEPVVQGNFYRAGTTDRYLVQQIAQQITSGKPEHSSVQDTAAQDTAALETEKFLHIRNLENLRGGIEAVERVKLKDKQHLVDLYLSWNYSNNDECIDGSGNDENVLEGLQPHPNLKILTISGFQGLKLPKWMGLSNYLPHLAELYFYGCNSCEQLPALGMLPCLRILQIKGMNLVKSLSEEFYYKQEECSGSNGDINEQGINMEKPAITPSPSSSSSRISVFPSLVELNLTDMHILEEWAAPAHSFDSFTSLESLIVSDCLRLKSIPLTSCSSLKSLELRNTNNEAVNSILASTGVERLTSLASVSIQDSPQLEFFPVVLTQKDFCIQSLNIGYCSKFQGFRTLDNNNNNKEFQAKLSSENGFNTSISSIWSLKLTDCPALTSLPDLREWTSLTELWIEDCDKLKKSFSYDLKSLSNLKSLYVNRIIDLRQE